MIAITMSSPAARFTTVRALAAYVGMSERTIMRWIKRGALRAGRVRCRHYADERERSAEWRGNWRIPEDAVIEFIAALRARRRGPIPPSLWTR